MKTALILMFLSSAALVAEVVFRQPQYSISNTGSSAAQRLVWWVTHSYGAASFANSEVKEALEYAFRTSRGLDLVVAIQPSYPNLPVNYYFAAEQGSYDPNIYGNGAHHAPDDFRSWWASSDSFQDFSQAFHRWGDYWPSAEQPDWAYVARFGDMDSGGIIVSEAEVITNYYSPTPPVLRFVMSTHYDRLDSDADGRLDKWDEPWSEPVLAEDFPDSSEDLDGDGLDPEWEFCHGSHPLWDDADVDLYVDRMLGDDSNFDGRSALPNLPDPGDGPKLSLRAAVRAAGSVGRILIQPGTYDESSLDLRGKNLTLRPNGEGVRLR